MKGAILGDIVGSVYEFNPVKTKDFDAFTYKSHVTDDSLMTFAVAQATMDFLDLCNNKIPEDPVTEPCYKTMVVKAMKAWGYLYPFQGYGKKFREWLYGNSSEPYNSYGNGSAMRVSSIGWLFNNLSDVQMFARWQAETTHNHPEGVKGAQAVATAIYYARNGKTKEFIKDELEKQFGYKFRSLDEIRPKYKFDVTCQGSVPEAIECFFESESVIDAIRNAVSLGGDADTQACMAGAIAEAFYKDNLGLNYSFIDSKLDEPMKYVLARFESRILYFSIGPGGLKNI